VPVQSMLASLDSEIAERVVRPNLEYRCFRVAAPFSEHVTIVTLQGEDREGFIFSIGSACRETRAASWEKSLLEAIHGRHYVLYLKTQVANGALKLGLYPTTFAEHAVWFSLHPELLHATVLHGAHPQAESRSGSPPESVQTLADRLGPERPVLFRSMTPPALAAERLGWQVVRVLVPGLQPLHGHHGLAHLGGPLWSPRKMADWQALPPHPFP
jgi:ribosomal protein S12 methylthiotransferase accessory factor